MVTFARFNVEEELAVKEIVARAIRLKIHQDPLDCRMDLSATHHTCPLRLADLAGADDFNFIHDVGGIRRYLNRETGNLEYAFLPRFARGGG